MRLKDVGVLERVTVRITSLVILFQLDLTYLIICKVRKLYLLTCSQYSGPRIHSYFYTNESLDRLRSRYTSRKTFKSELVLFKLHRRPILLQLHP